MSGTSYYYVITFMTACYCSCQSKMVPSALCFIITTLMSVFAVWSGQIKLQQSEPQFIYPFTLVHDSAQSSKYILDQPSSFSFHFMFYFSVFVHVFCVVPCWCVVCLYCLCVCCVVCRQPYGPCNPKLHSRS